MADEILDDVLTKLPVLATALEGTDVKRGEVYCSKIIHQNASHQSRFTWTVLYRKIMQYNGHDGEGKVFPRPLKSPFPCYNCHELFDTPPIFLPIMVLNGSRTESYNFCDPTCANTYLHTNMNDSNLAARVADFVEYLQDVHGFTGSHIGFAPHFTMLEKYGGSLTLAEFRKIARTPGLRTCERMAPFIPTESVVEWQCRIDEMEATADIRQAVPAPPPSTCAFGSDRHADDRKKSASASEALAKLLGYKPESANHHHQWEVRGLRQPPLEVIEKRLLSLPKPEEKEGAYKLYWERHGGAAASTATGPQVDAKQAPVPARASKKTKHVSETNSLGGMLVTTKKAPTL
jgi:hypothetical protein